MNTSNNINGSVRQWRRYAAYKESGLSTGVQIPVHWSMMRLKCVAAVRPSNVDKKTVEGQEPVRLCNYVDVYKNDYITEGFDFMQASASPAQIAAFTLIAGDVIITKDSETWDDIAVPAYVITDLPGVLCGYHLALVRPKPGKISGEYLFRSFGAEGVCDQFRVAANGITRFGLDTASINDSLFPLPPVEEQNRIVACLDRETAKIDALIAKKERLIGLLQEKRVALIGHAVAQGLDPTVPMKDSGLDWAGQIPAHWLVCHQKYLWKRCDYGISESLSGNGGIRVLTMGHIQDGEIVVPEMGCVEEVPPMLFLHKHDLLFNRTNSLELVGKVGLFRGDESDRVSFASYLVRLRVNDKANAVYLNYLLNSPGFLRAAQSLALPSINQANLNATRYGNISIAVPPPEEQKRIVEFLDDESSQIARLIAKVREGIEKLQEYRTALISAAVTGKIDVREEFV